MRYTLAVKSTITPELGAIGELSPETEKRISKACLRLGKTRPQLIIEAVRSLLQWIEADPVSRIKEIQAMAAQLPRSQKPGKKRIAMRAMRAMRDFQVMPSAVQSV